MTDFYGSSDVESTRDLFLERIDYKLDAYENLGPKEQVRDLNFTENTMYGCIDPFMDTVFPSSDNMKIISTNMDTDTGPRALDFVVDAFNSVVESFNTACQTNTIPIDDPYLSTLRVSRAYQDPLGLYEQYIENLMERFLREYIVGKNHRDKILNVRDYIHNLHIFLKNEKTFTPLTLTSWHRSTFSNVFTSGLAIDISGLGIDDDRPKQLLFLENPIFPFFLNVCKANGFLIPHNSPWIMVADILSPAMAEYTKPYSMYTTRDVFQQRFNKAFATDMSLVKDLIFEHYNRFVNTFKAETLVDCNCKNITMSQLFVRQSISRDVYDNAYNDDEWIEFYFNIRNIEEKQPFNKQKNRNLLLRAKNKTSSIDISEGISYINQQFRLNYRKRYGGLNKFGDRIEMRRTKTKIPHKSNQTRPNSSASDPTFSPPTPFIQSLESFEEIVEQPPRYADDE